MQIKTISEVNEKYDLEIDKVVRQIKKEKGKSGSESKDSEGYKVLLQFPEGLKPYSMVICDEVSDKANCECFIWLGTCFGACDVPLEVENIGVDMIIQFGHSKNVPFLG